MIDDFERGVLPERFDHAEHVRLTFLLIERYGEVDGLARLDRGLRELAGARYHATITWAYGYAIADRMAAAPQDWATFRHAHPELLEPELGLLRRWYTRDRLFSDRARAAFVMPEKVA